ncbi:MAG: hypothetical protein JST06_00780, partial [Bacteroidetes bacterium]|nr:hypothetical protein [Bacteroidota bacterium]
AEVKNGAVIEHARVGLGNNGESVEVNPLAFSGGIIRADGVFFHDNARSVAFGPYHNKLGRLNLPNESRISRCVFKVDDAYRGQALGYGFLAHKALSDVDGVYIAAGRNEIHKTQTSIFW